MKKLLILLLTLTSLTFVSCDAVSMAAYNEAQGNCTTYHVEVKSWVDGVWKDGTWYDTSWSQSELDNFYKWLDAKGNYYTYIKVGEYQEKYDDRYYKFVVTCY